MLVVGDLLRAACARLGALGVPEPRLSAAHIMAGALGVTSLGRVAAASREALTPAQAAVFVAGIDARAARRVPVQYILGEWSFRGLSLAMRPPVLIPRPETEHLVELALGQLRSRGGTGAAAAAAPVAVLDVGCGSGAIALAILTESPRHVSAHACDMSRSAVRLTTENARRLGLSDRLTVHHCRASELGSRLWQGSGSRAVAEDSGAMGIVGRSEAPRFQMLVSNPPYIKRADMAGLAPELLLHESHRALNGGVDGLRVAREVLAAARGVCEPGAVVLLELGGDGHPEQLAAEAAARPEWRVEPRGFARDLQGVQRFVQFQVLE